MNLRLTWLSNSWRKISRAARSSWDSYGKNWRNNNKYKTVLTCLMREERYQGQHDAQPSSSMILHAGYFYERYRIALFLPSSTNDDATTMITTTTTTTMTTDLVVLYSPLFYWQLLTAASRHWTISVNDVHITVILSYLIAHTTRLSQYVVSHIYSDRVYHLLRGDNRRLLVDYCFPVTIRDCDHALPYSILFFSR